MQSLSWQEQLAQAIRQPNDLLDYVGLMADSIGYSQQSIEQFPVRVPYAFADRIQRNNPDDPLLRQVFPYIDEEDDCEGYVNDPLAEANVQPVQGLLHKYNSRVLSISTGACAIHCRYCFRRHFPYQESSTNGKHLEQSLDYIRSDETIKEVILSGGDPLTLSDRRLIELCQALSQIDHIKRIRFHTRIPVVLPARLSEELIKQIANIGKTLIFVLHINHANEIDDAVINNIKLLRRFNILVLNQSVLLKGINDSTESLIALSERLVENQVTPYYLHLLDPVTGTAHFNVDEQVAKILIQKMHESVSGYLVPRLVKEEVGKAGKTRV
ncbi:MAG TPA: EF-P beta-lysylation protein EpmB [Thiotrichaceae bacterium]|jgi:EF-P beta-lysylation protein EpmB|nr:EF-P beta-lysylation protein EpmB [Thiotrichaceae bacterium]HIM06945.1 EF-P beta-lysylation protein EpmB [Gammaproteobacteria bacterium]